MVTPPVQLYDEAPVPLNVTAVPAQTVDDGETAAPTVGNEFTIIVTELEVAGLPDTPDIFEVMIHVTTSESFRAEVANVGELLPTLLPLICH